MPQAAQQDYLQVHIADIDQPTDAEKSVLLEKVKQGIIYDCDIIISGGAHTRVLAYIPADDLSTANIILYDAGNDQMVTIDLSTE